MAKPILTDEQWKQIEPLLPPPKLRSKGRKRGRPPKGNRQVLEGILWILKTGARWRDLPRDFGVSSSVCWKRLRRWEAQGVWLRLWRAFLSELDGKDKLDWDEVFLDGSFASAKKGAPELAKPSAARARSGWWWSTARAYLWEAS
jgi:transposase